MFLDYLFSITMNGALHRKMEYQKLLKYLKDTYGGLDHLAAKLELRTNFS